MKNEKPGSIRFGEIQERQKLINVFAGTYNEQLI